MFSRDVEPLSSSLEAWASEKRDDVSCGYVLLAMGCCAEEDVAQENFSCYAPKDCLFAMLNSLDAKLLMLLNDGVRSDFRKASVQAFMVRRLLDLVEKDVLCEGDVEVIWEMYQMELKSKNLTDKKRKNDEK